MILFPPKRTYTDLNSGLSQQGRQAFLLLSKKTELGLPEAENICAWVPKDTVCWILHLATAVYERDLCKHVIKTKESPRSKT